MKKNNLLILQAIIIVLVLLLQIFWPVLSIAEDTKVENTIRVNSVISSENNRKELTIDVSDRVYMIKRIKIKKVASLDEIVDFTTQGDTIEDNINSRGVKVRWIVSDEGIYKIYAENEQGSSFVWTTVVYEDNPIVINWKQNAEQDNKLEISVQDTMFDIISVKIAKYEENKEIDWGNATVLYSSETKNNPKNLEYIIPESGKYSIRAEDLAGISFILTTSSLYITEESNPGETNPGGNNPGETNQGGNNQGGSNPGASNPGGNNPGGSNPGGSNPGGTNPGASNPGGNNSGASNPGKNNSVNNTNNNSNSTQNSNKPSQNGTNNNQGSNNKYNTTSQSSGNTVKDNTMSNKTLPQTGLKMGVLVVIIALVVKAIISLRKYLKIR